MTFARLNRADWVAFGAALALLLFLAVDWYGTVQGDEARRLEGLAQPSGAAAGEVEREVRDDARFAAERAEKNAFQADGLIDRVILVMLLAAIAAAVAAAFLRAAGRRFEPPRTPSNAASVLAALAALLVAYRMVQEPGLDAATTLKIGSVLGVLAAGTIALAARAAHRAEVDGSAFREPETQAPAEAAS
ncbi:MAG TPA: hypothetical protein VNT32_09965 [Thermoleophilaceae bacterium]|nr:hypothetical protein [Thermoleophilaceae bacterium]